MSTRRSFWVHIRRLRKKIELNFHHPRYIVTVIGQGYYLPLPDGEFSGVQCNLQ